MAHFAKIQDSKVIEVIVISNDSCGGGNFPESEIIGQEFIASIGLEGDWKQTSYSSSFRSKFAGIGDEWNEESNQFIISNVEIL